MVYNNEIHFFLQVVNVRSAPLSHYNPQCEESLKHVIAENIKSTIDDFMKLNDSLRTTVGKLNDCDDFSCQLQEYTNILLTVFDLMRKQLFSLGSMSTELLRCNSNRIDYSLEDVDDD